MVCIIYCLVLREVLYPFLQDGSAISCISSSKEDYSPLLLFFKSRLVQTFFHCNEPCKDQAHCIDFQDKIMWSVKRPSKQFHRPSLPQETHSPRNHPLAKQNAVVNHKSQNVILRSCVTLLSIKYTWVTTHTKTGNRTEDAHQGAFQSKPENDGMQCGFIFHMIAAITAREVTS